ncbi:MAG: hypothetical protein ACK4N5_04885, partial [Myxococcales bacterium]
SRMMSSGFYLCVYWGGAVLALAADVAIREASGGARSLDDVVRALHRGGRFADERDVFAAIDAAAAPGTGEALRVRCLDADPFLALPGLLRSLGVERRGGGVGRIDEAPLARHRDAATARGPAQ